MLLTALLSIGGAAMAGLFGALLGGIIGALRGILTIGNVIVCLIGWFVGGILRRG